MKFPMFLAALLASACAAQVAAPRPAQDFVFEITDSLARQRFEVKLTAGARDICLSSHNWPSGIGDLHFASETVAVVTDSGRFPARDSNLGYCTGDGCTTRIPAGQHITGFIPYAEFPGLSEVPASAPRRLDFPVRPHEC